MKIVGTATAFPVHYYQQKQISNALRAYWGSSPENTAKIERFHRTAGVDGRFLSLPLSDFPKVADWGAANDVWIARAEDLGEAAIRKSVELAGIPIEKVGALFFVSITGIANPSIDARLMNRLPFSPHLRRVPIFGLGCVGGAAGLSRASDYVRAYPDQAAVLLSVELCSLTWQRQDLTTANMISTALFGDGAAAVVVAGKNILVDGPAIVDTRSTFYPDTQAMMGWDITQDGLRVVLSAGVPDIVFNNLGADVDRFLSEHGLRRDDIKLWMMHTGGPKVLEAMARSLDLPRQALQNSWDCLKRVGNLSSASVLCVLDDVMRNKRPEKGTWSILAAMGPGFCSELVLIRF